MHRPRCDSSPSPSEDEHPVLGQPPRSDMRGLCLRVECMWTVSRFDTATKIKALRAAGLSNTDIIAAFRQGLVEALLS